MRAVWAFAKIRTFAAVPIFKGAREGRGSVHQGQAAREEGAPCSMVSRLVRTALVDLGATNWRVGLRPEPCRCCGQDHYRGGMPTITRCA